MAYPVIFLNYTSHVSLLRNLFARSDLALSQHPKVVFRSSRLVYKEDTRDEPSQIFTLTFLTYGSST